MAEHYDQITPEQQLLIEESPVFFVAKVSWRST